MDSLGRKQNSHRTVPSPMYNLHNSILLGDWLSRRVCLPIIPEVLDSSSGTEGMMGRKKRRKRGQHKPS